jgi:hypothetical protein
MVHAATAVMTPANPRNAFLDWRALSSGVGILIDGGVGSLGKDDKSLLLPLDVTFSFFFYQSERLLDLFVDLEGS